jgi:GNAT superfamily N-acetyltransferase
MNDLSYLLEPKVSQIGDEKAVYETENGICKYVSREGSYRYVYKTNGMAVGALQVVSRDRKNAIIANVFTLPEYRRQKLAKKLLLHARSEFQTVEHSPMDLTDLGKLWKKGLHENNSSYRMYW